MHLEIKEPLSNMKLKVLNIIFSLFVLACGISSCLDSDVVEYEFSSDASITAFSIADSIITSYPAVVKGKDTTLTFSVVGAKYPFVINQKEGLIYNPDSLPVGTDISKVVVNITADTKGIYIVAEKDSIWEDTDSLNFEKPIQFKVMSEMGAFGRNYTAKINVHQLVPDSLSWTKLGSNFSKNIQKQKAVYANKNIYVFATNESGISMTQTMNGSEWSELTATDLPAEANYASVMAWGNMFYILVGNELYTSVDGIAWNKVETEQRFSHLLANIHTDYNQKLIGIDTENYYLESEDGITWIRNEEMPSEFPTNNVSSVSFALKTNEKISKIVLMGHDDLDTDTTTTIWTQLSTEGSWTELTLENRTYACPKLENQGMILYNNNLYTFGGSGQFKGAIDAFCRFYVSEDDGISWEAITTQFMFPSAFKALYEASEGDYSYIVDDQQFIWFMWSQTGEVWRGRLNKLGFDKQ